MTAKTVTILLIEDDIADVKAVRRGFKKERISNPMRVAEDGLVALDVLRGTGGQEPIQRPYVILLDLNMPRMNGIEFLEALRKDSEHHGAVVFVLTTSDADRDRTSAYAQHVAGYILKTNVGGEFARLATMLGLYWKLVEFP